MSGCAYQVKAIRICVCKFASKPARQALGYHQPIRALHQRYLHVIMPTLSSASLENICLVYPCVLHLPLAKNKAPEEKPRGLSLTKFLANQDMDAADRRSLPLYTCLIKGVMQSAKVKAHRLPLTFLTASRGRARGRAKSITKQ